VLARGLAVGAVLWVVAIVVAPFAIASPRRLLSLGAAAVYAGGSRVCHQRAERCFRLDGRPMPVCARCTGLYASAAVGAPLALFLAGAVSSRRARHITVVAALPTLLTWSLEMAGVAHPSNIVRAMAAVPLGFATAWLVITATRSTHE
jgi:uncharacterized membrane protein